MNLEDLRLFAVVAGLRSFAKASEQTGVARSTLSRVIKRLESEVGTPLLHRTTRTVGLTSAGASLLERARPSLDDLERMIDDLEEQKGEPSGVLRVTTSPDLAVSLLTPVLSRLVQTYPRLRIETVLTLRAVDLIEEKVDVALRVYRGVPTGAGLTGRRLTNMTFGWYATPAYLERHGTPVTENDLVGHQLIAIGMIVQRPQIKVDDPFFGLAMTRSSAGIGLLSDELCREEVERGTLIRVLPQVVVFEGQVWFLYPSGVISPAVAALRDGLVEHLVEQRSAASSRTEP